MKEILELVKKLKEQVIELELKITGDKIFLDQNYHLEVEGFPFYSEVVNGYGEKGIVLPISKEYNLDNLGRYKVGVMFYSPNERTIEIDNDDWVQYTTDGRYEVGKFTRSDIKLI